MNINLFSLKYNITCKIAYSFHCSSHDLFSLFPMVFLKSEVTICIHLLEIGVNFLFFTESLSMFSFLS